MSGSIPSGRAGAAFSFLGCWLTRTFTHHLLGSVVCCVLPLGPLLSAENRPNPTSGDVSAGRWPVLPGTIGFGDRPRPSQRAEKPSQETAVASGSESVLLVGSAFLAVDVRVPASRWITSRRCL